MATDYKKLPNEIIVDLINSSTPGAAFTTALLSFGLPTAATGSSPTRDTELTVTAVDGSGYKGSVVIKYNRVDLAVVPGTRSTDFPIGDAQTISDLIPEINERFKINLQPVDYVNAPLPAFTGQPNESHTFQLSAGADSLVWRASVTLTVSAEDIELSTVITNDEMNGLVYTQPDASGNYN